MKKTILALALTISVGAISSCSQKDSYVSKKNLKEVCDSMDMMFPEDAPGAALLIMQKDSVILTKCCGWGDIVTKDPITPETNFCLASISKQFTAVAILKLCEQGKMSLDDKVRSFFPQFTDTIWNKITVRQLLSHSSGLPDARNGYTYLQRVYGNDDRSVEFFDSLNTLSSQPGTTFLYNNPAYVLAGKIIEKVSGEPFADFMRKNILDPAGMKNSQYFEFTANEITAEEITAEEQPIINMAHGYVDNGKGWEEKDFGEDTFFATRPDGGLYSSVSDMALWEKALHSGILMKDEVLKQAWVPQISVSESEMPSSENHLATGYGLGWFIEESTDKSGTVYYHEGVNGGFRNIVARYSEQEIMIVLLSVRPYVSQYEYLQKIEAILGL